MKKFTNSLIHESEHKNSDEIKKIGITLTGKLIVIDKYDNEFTLGTPKGFVSNDNSDFTIVNVPNAKQKDLYKNVLNAINSMYSNPQKGLNVVDGESISLTAYEENALTVKHSAGGFGKRIYKYDLSYTLSFLFKDGKIRINTPVFECKRWYEGTYKPTSGWSSSGWFTLKLVKGKNDMVAIYDKEGKLLLEDASNGLNNHFNSVLKQIIEKSQKINNW